jgi:hypothetical protein
MAGFFTNEEKTELSDIFNTLHETFSREIYMFKQRDELVITENPNHSYIWDNAPTNTQTISTIISGKFNARILYSNKQNKDFVSTRQRDGGEDQIGAEIFNGDVRLKLDPTGALFLKDAQRVKFDGDIFEISTDKRPHGLFDPKWETFYLKRVN